jgi:pancreatic triacylglycerol lipase
MKSKLAVLLSLFVLVTSDIPCVYREATKMFTEGPEEKYNITAETINFYFKSSSNPNGIGPVDLSNADEVTSAGFSASKDTAFVVHGWQNDHTSEVCTLVPKAFTDTKDINVFVVDWSSVAKGLYISAYKAVPDIGKLLATNIQYLISNNGLDLSRTAIIGHSLGAHVSGIAGQTLGSQAGYIIGLDPALPCFSYNDIDGRLDTTDAKYVEIIHTCAGMLGFDVDIGHADYYPNGGSNQPGCSAMDVTGSCSHGRSYMYYAESIVSSGFVSKQCNSYKDFQNGNCNGVTSDMGDYFINKQASGTYYLYTNSQSPFAQN